MPDHRLGDAARLLGVSDDTLRRWIDDGRLPSRQDAAGRRVVSGADLAAFVTERHTSDAGAPHSSARNRLRGLVTRVTVDGVMAQVELQCGPYRVVSLMSREAAEELGLEAGSVAVASIKATNVVVEIDEGARA